MLWPKWQRGRLQCQLYCPRSVEHPWRWQAFHLSVFSGFKMCLQMGTRVVSSGHCSLSTKWLERHSSVWTTFLVRSAVTLGHDATGELVVLVKDANAILGARLQLAQLDACRVRFDHDFGGLVQAEPRHFFGADHVVAKGRNDAGGLTGFDGHAVFVFHVLNKHVRIEH